MGQLSGSALWESGRNKFQVLLQRQYGAAAPGFNNNNEIPLFKITGRCYNTAVFGRDE
jgi:hypothetical protein